MKKFMANPVLHGSAELGMGTIELLGEPPLIGLAEMEHLNSVTLAFTLDPPTGMSQSFDSSSSFEELG